MSNRYILGLLVLLSAVSGAGGQTSLHADSIYLSNEEWHVSIEPKRLGFDPDKLAAADALIRAGNTSSMVVTVGPDLLYMYGDCHRVSYVASVRKSILAILYGNYVADGTVNLDATLEDLQFDDRDGLLPIERKATVRDLITARSGVYHPASNEGDNTDFAPQRGSKVPGTYFLYNNWDFNAAGTVLEMQTGLEVYDIFEQHIAKPLGFQDFRRRSHKKTGNNSQSNHLAYHFFLSTRDMARIGYLMLRDGNWFGEQVVPVDWVRRIRTTFTPRSEMNPPHVREEPLEYGYMWWIYAGSDSRLEGVYTASGAYGQFITVVPKLELVVAHKVNPSMSDRIKYENATEKISVLQNQYLEIVAAIADAKSISTP